jgi:hypothetical protein
VYRREQVLWFCYCCTITYNIQQNKWAQQRETAAAAGEAFEAAEPTMDAEKEVTVICVTSFVMLFKNVLHNINSAVQHRKLPAILSAVFNISSCFNVF